MRKEHDLGHGHRGAPFSATIRRLLAGVTSRSDAGSDGEFADLPTPDLLWRSNTAGPSPGRLLDLLDLGFLGRASAGELDSVLDAIPVGASPWDPAHFANDLFLAELVRHGFPLGISDASHPAHAGFITRVITHPPVDADDIRYRQDILSELDRDPTLAAASERLARSLMHLLDLLRASRDDARLEPVRFRIDVLRAFRRAVEIMADEFATAASGLRRLHEVGGAIASTGAFRRLQDLLDHQESMAHLRLEAVVGADGRLRHLEIRELRERRGNPFFRRPIRRWWDRFRIFYHRYRLGADELVDRLVMGVYHDISPAMARVVQTLCHLEVYLGARGFAVLARSRGLEVCLPQMGADRRLGLRSLFNPLLLSITERPVPTDLIMDTPSPITLVTGPNSGGKTRLLQAVGIAQVLGQSGLYAPCSQGGMPVASGLFASIVELDRPDQPEGRLGTEMVRLRMLFENAPPGSLVLLDELCSGTNPSEAEEIVEMVLRMLRRIDPVAFVTTHFLDFAEQLRTAPVIENLRFLQAEVDPERGATYRFLAGVARTSLAVGTARRLGLTFEELDRLLPPTGQADRRRDH